VQIVCGDTKVVERGQADGLYLNTAGVGVFSFPTNISCSNARPGDRILLSGIPGIHGLAVMLARHASFGLNAALCSDVQPLHGLVRDLLVNGVEVRVLRDLTRGGLTAAVLDIAEHSSVTLEIQQAAVPTTDAQQAACDLLGLDQLTIAGEGCCLLIVPEQQAEQALSVMRRQAAGVNATEIGIVRSSGRQPAELITSLGTRRAMVMPRGEQLPRIC
jgi:hydrogenase expression/formation protein HypE